jgi:hypothetical protein
MFEIIPFISRSFLCVDNILWREPKAALRTVTPRYIFETLLALTTAEGSHP